MNAIFPFGYESTTAWYLVLYLGTLLMHLILMSYVIAGSAWLANSRLRIWSSPAQPIKERSTITIVDILTDWMPFALGGAITAGVAPLLFVQILYQEKFYTANLLLFHRWMSILPVLIVGFYLLYVQKAQWSAAKQENRSRGWLPLAMRSLVSVLAIGCFGFVGYSWTENHLLANQPDELWSSFYRDRRMFYFDSQMIPRLGIWFCGTFPAMLWILAGQRWLLRTPESATFDLLAADEAAGNDRSLEKWRREQSTMSTVVMVSLALGWGFVVWYGWCLTEQEKAAVFTITAAPYWGLAMVGTAIQIRGWWRFKDQTLVDLRWIMIIGAGLILMMIGGLVLRELLRVSHVDLGKWQQAHRQSAAVGGMYVFFVFLLLNIGIAIWCLRGVLKSKI